MILFKFRKLIFWSIPVLVAIVWLGFWIVGDDCSQFLAKELVERQNAITQKTPNVKEFVSLRIYELLSLCSIIFLLIWVDSIFWILFSRAFKRSMFGWIITSTVIFAQINVVAFFLANSCIFWIAAAQTNGDAYERAAFEIKRNIVFQNDSPRRAILLGNSQVNAAVDEDILNLAVGNEIWTNDLFFPGASVFDLILVWDSLSSNPPDVALIYVSELSLHSDVGRGRAYPALMGVSGFFDFVDLGGPQRKRSEQLWYAFVSRMFPLFDIRSPICDAILGVDSNGPLKVVGLAAEPQDRESVRQSFRIGKNFSFQKRSLRKLVESMQALGTEPILMVGEVAPDFASKMSPEIRESMMRFLSQLSEEKGICLLNPSGTRFSAKEEFRDSIHVNEIGQVRYSKWLLEQLRIHGVVKN